MTALSPITTLEEAHRRAVEEANQWRGRLVNHYSRVEYLISKVLHGQGGSKSLPPTLGQRLESLRESCGQSDKLSNVLDELKERVSERNAIAHGRGSIYVDRDGEWILILDFFGRQKPERIWLDRPMLEANCKVVHSIEQKLNSRLKDLSSRSSGPADRPSA